MKRSKKILIIIAVVLIAAGAAISMTAFAKMDYSITRLNRSNPETKTVEISKTFKNISANVTQTDIRIMPSDNNKCSVYISENDKIHHTANVENNTLVINEEDNRKWHDFIFNFYTDLYVEIYLPQKEYNKLYVSTNSGDININSGFKFEQAECGSTSGDITFSSDVTNNAELSSTSGNVRAEKMNCNIFSLKSTSGDVIASDMRIKSSGQFKSTSGDTELNNVISENKLSLESTSGDISLNSCDANKLDLNSTSGDISGTIRTNKKFFADSISGDIDVPNSSGSGECNAETTSGDITLDIE